MPSAISDLDKGSMHPMAHFGLHIVDSLIQLDIPSYPTLIQVTNRVENGLEERSRLSRQRGGRRDGESSECQGQRMHASDARRG